MYIAVEGRPNKAFQRLVRQDSPHAGGVQYSTWLGSCGVGWLQDFSSVSFYNWKDKAEWVSALYRNMYQPGNVLYAITQNQLQNHGHLLLVELGATQITEFPNLTHSPNRMLVFHVNIRNAVGRFCNKYGEPYAEPPKDASEVEEQGVFKSNHSSGWMVLPVRPK